MDIEPVRHRRRAATRAALLEAGRRLVEEQGAQAAQVGNITRAAGVAHGTFYVHFNSKDDLLDELWAELDASLQQRLQPLLDHALERPAAEVLADIAGTCLDHWMAHRGLLSALAERAAARSDLKLLRDGVSPTLSRLVTDVLVRTNEARGTDPSNAALVAQGILGMWMRIGLRYVFGEDDRPTRQQAIQTLVTMTSGAVGAGAP